MILIKFATEGQQGSGVKNHKKKILKKFFSKNFPKFATLDMAEFDSASKDFVLKSVATSMEFEVPRIKPELDKHETVSSTIASVLMGRRAGPGLLDKMEVLHEANPNPEAQAFMAKSDALTRVMDKIDDEHVLDMRAVRTAGKVKMWWKLEEEAAKILAERVAARDPFYAEFLEAAAENQAALIQREVDKKLLAMGRDSSGRLLQK